MTKNYYELLELNKDATIDDIKKQYKKLALKYHPDRNYNNKKDNELKFKEITEAYNVLSDKDKKKNYDYFGLNDNNTFNDSINNPFTDSFDDILSKMFNFKESNLDDLLKDDIKPKIFVNISKVPLNNSYSNNNDIFNNITNIMDDILFNGINNFNHPINNKQKNFGNNKIKEKSYDLLDLNVTLDDIINSNKKTIKYKIKDICSYCNGTYALEPSDIIECLYCKGTNSNCGSCNGTGKIFKTQRRCNNCINGIVEKDTIINVSVPKGVPNNHIFIIKNKGSYNNEKKNYNDIKLKFIYNLQEDIKIKENNILIKLDITIQELFCGFKKQIKLSKNIIEITMDKYFNPSEPIIYKNMGIPKYKNDINKGDLILEFNVIYPSSDNKIMHKYKEVFTRIFSKLNM